MATEVEELIRCAQRLAQRAVPELDADGLQSVALAVLVGYRAGRNRTWCYRRAVGEARNLRDLGPLGWEVPTPVLVLPEEAVPPVLSDVEHSAREVWRLLPPRLWPLARLLAAGRSPFAAGRELGLHQAAVSRQLRSMRRILEVHGYRGDDLP